MMRSKSTTPTTISGCDCEVAAVTWPVAGARDNTKATAACRRYVYMIFTDQNLILVPNRKKLFLVGVLLEERISKVEGEGPEERVRGYAPAVLLLQTSQNRCRT